MEIAVVVILLVAGLINGLPVIGVAGAGRLARLYGLTMADPDLLVLMRHRALLLGLLGAALVGAAFVPGWRAPAMVAGLVSMLAFVVLARAAPGPKIRTTAIVDVALSAALAVALVLHLLPH
ncbi:hypothetical protein [Pseudonocardia alaniniphila]|uniref:Phosphopantetheine adenylyltransferase n=1 Tax=Pseudonocardia alaniniphila TaxID=75291 RepID=A0ABS9T7H5_9PSEU|nr:hypothetical protein [Pseudonocardia alaniniphila]MCH6164455.1 hypothetical protein [Pseudonocardia alaniniphila]